MCDDVTHTAAISRMYNSIVDGLLDSSKPLQERANIESRQIPEWNDLYKDLHDQARDAVLRWFVNGKPRSGAVYQIMKTA
jgi:hypothetical protein